MRQSLKACVFVVAASGVLGAYGSAAYADAGAGGSATNSPGVLSGNSIQVTVDTPVNACGNSVNAGAALNPAMGNSCGNGGAPRPAARPPLAHAPGVSFRRAPEPDHGPGRQPAGHRAAAPAESAHEPAGPAAQTPAGPLTHKPVPHPVHDPRVGASARAGASTGSALLAATGPGALSALAATGGGLLLGGVLLLRRARPRRS
ncbi:chaplin family protein [Streptomyces sioyaensis]|uniref:chaplin n=1 Tax=Streptomyces sioyaensis TaxID=67364 RepID=UPI0037D3F53E